MDDYQEQYGKYNIPETGPARLQENPVAFATSTEPDGEYDVNGNILAYSIKY